LSKGGGGLQEDQIAKICTLTFREKYVFSKVSSGFSEFTSSIIAKLEKEHACFAGYRHGDTSHVVVIGKHSDGRIALIDPQQNLYCLLDDNACFAHIAKKDHYYLLRKAKGTLTRAQLQKLGFVV